MYDDDVNSLLVASNTCSIMMLSDDDDVDVIDDVMTADTNIMWLWMMMGVMLRRGAGRGGSEAVLIMRLIISIDIIIIFEHASCLSSSYDVTTQP